MDRATIIWWCVGIAFAFMFITMSVPHLAREEGPLTVFLLGGVIGAGIVYGVIDHRRQQERTKQELEKLRRGDDAP